MRILCARDSEAFTKVLSDGERDADSNTIVQGVPVMELAFDNNVDSHDEST